MALKKREFTPERGSVDTYMRIVDQASRLIVHRSLIATTSGTISYDGSCHRYSPIVRDSATTRKDR